MIRDGMTADTDAQIVSYRLSEDDLVAFNVYTSTKSRFNRRRYVGRCAAGWLVVPVIGILACIIGDGWNWWESLKSNAEIIMVGTAIYAFLYVPYPSRIRGAALRRVRDGTFAQILSPQRLEISSDGVKMTGDSVEAVVRWKAIIDMPITEKALYMYFTSIQAVVVPRHAFMNKESFAGFAHAAEGFWKKASAAA
jgi:hypothetical protein